MAEKFSLKDHLFNSETVGRLAAEFAAGVPGFDAARFKAEALGGFADRELMERLDWMADCLEPQLAPDFPEMADHLEAALPERLDPALKDDDFGHFIHAVHGILTVRHGLEAHRDRALDLLHAATQRFSMEYYIRPFLNRWTDETLARLALWAEDENYHVRRLVSEGTRPKLPWAKAVDLRPDQTLPLLDKLHGDDARFVTRSIANHLNDITKGEPDLVMDRLEMWAGEGRQSAKELDWMTRHALRTRVKAGHPRAMKMLGFDPDATFVCDVALGEEPVQIGGALAFSVTLKADQKTPVLVDYVLKLRNAKGGQGEKVFKLKQAVVQPGTPLVLDKVHKLKAAATTFRLFPGEQGLVVQVNGRAVAETVFELLE
ncbi:hypothetical protein [Thalassococcus sp. S3]|uniref:hypothetical protein n=1 Tax=Thalassococcus sp. S3 TaxID=2017482 RepID=UPI001023FCA1|nr:hypothetical protein [Thalassococcus sp. S3]QBF31370.1 hypothetical protein CFI11_09075 [Thalassococcus sp. S3]